MNSKVPNGFHQAIVSATVFLAGATLAYLKFFVVDESAESWSLFAVVSALAACCAMIVQVVTLHRALQLTNDDPQMFARTVRLLMTSVWLLVASGVSLVIAHWWQPLPGLTQWMNT